MKKEVSRRDFLKQLSIAGATTIGLTACGEQVKNTIAPVQQSQGDMTYRTHPQNGDRVSLLGYGCMRWPFIPNPEGEGEIIDQESVNSLVDYALEHGINYFDSAPPYCQGLSETATGIALSRHPRNSYYLATKLSNHHLTRTGLRGKELYDASLKMYHHSFEALKTDYIDYYLLHNLGGDSGMPFLMDRFFNSGVLEFLLKEREAGRIRNLGFSYHGDVKVFDYMLSLHDQMKWDFVQIQLNYVDYRHASGMNFNAEYLYNELSKRHIPVVVMEPLLGGRLASLPTHLNEKLKKQRPQDSIASWAFRFAGSLPDVLTVLSGMTYKEHLEDNLKTFSPLNPCSAAELQLLENVAQDFVLSKSVPCTACEYCMPCPYGINIPAIFTHYNKCINEGNIPSSTQDENYAKERRAFLIGYDRSVPRLRQANHCIGCGQCIPHCPQSIQIPEELHRIDDFVEQVKQNNIII